MAVRTDFFDFVPQSNDKFCKFVADNVPRHVMNQQQHDELNLLLDVVVKVLRKLKETMSRSHQGMDRWDDICVELVGSKARATDVPKSDVDYVIRGIHVTTICLRSFCEELRKLNAKSQIVTHARGCQGRNKINVHYTTLKIREEVLAANNVAIQPRKVSFLRLGVDFWFEDCSLSLLGRRTGGRGEPPPLSTYNVFPAVNPLMLTQFLGISMGSGFPWEALVDAISPDANSAVVLEFLCQSYDTTTQEETFDFALRLKLGEVGDGVRSIIRLLKYQLRHMTSKLPSCYIEFIVLMVLELFQLCALGASSSSESLDDLHLYQVYSRAFLILRDGLRVIVFPPNPNIDRQQKQVGFVIDWTVRDRKNARAAPAPTALQGEQWETGKGRGGRAAYAKIPEHLLAKPGLLIFHGLGDPERMQAAVQDCRDILSRIHESTCFEFTALRERLQSLDEEELMTVQKETQELIARRTAARNRDLKRLRDEKEVATRCVICMDRQKTRLFLPCGHVCVCEICGDGLLARATNYGKSGGKGSEPGTIECPVCRESVTNIVNNVKL